MNSKEAAVAAEAVSAFFEAVQEHGFGGEMLQKITVAATPVIVAVALTEGNLWQALLSTLTKTSCDVSPKRSRMHERNERSQMPA